MTAKHIGPPVEAIRQLVDYMHDDELDDFEAYEEGEAPPDHIYLSVKAVAEWLRHNEQAEAAYAVPSEEESALKREHFQAWLPLATDEELRQAGESLAAWSASK